LKELDLRAADFHDGAVKHLMSVRTLEEITLNNTQLSDVGFQELLKLPRLQSLWVDRTKITKSAYKSAKKEHPKVRLYYYSYDNE
jgi:hypothetical protein